MSRFFLLSLFLLAGCTGVAKFDNMEYMRIVDATTTLSADDCDDKSPDKKVLTETITKFRSQIDWLSTYEGGLPNNTLTSKMLIGVAKEGSTFNVNGSNFYCKLKMQEMRHTLRLILNAEARKPTE